jgi:phospholipase/carboxylesterase
MNSKRDTVVIEPQSAHKASDIWLHGLGADGHDFEPIVPELRLPNEHGIRFIFPHAPKRPVTINGGMVMRAWYDIRMPDLSLLEDENSIRESSDILNSYIDDEINAGVTADKILIAGFSQGGAIALFAGLRYPQKLAGLLALSTYLPLPDQLKVETTNANSEIPLMMMHGTFDPIVPVFQGHRSRDLLQQAGYSIEWREYPMQHAVCSQEINDISYWLQQRLLGDVD